MENNTPEELMKPRYLVIAKYPHMEQDQVGVGNVIRIYGMGFMFPDKVMELYDSCPANFRKLEWWEFREVLQMPEYVKTKAGNSVRKVESICLRTELITFEGGKIRKLKQWFPATLTDYLNFKNKEK